MKPKFRRLLKVALPALIVVPAMGPFAKGGTITPDTAGNVLVPFNYNGGLPAADTIQASGGSTAPFTVTVQNGAILTGDLVIMDGVEVTSADYTINNFGSLSGALNGIDSAGFEVDVNNSGSITGIANEGIEAVGGGSVVTNNASATITGGDDAVYFNSDGGTVINSGTLSGITGISSDGIQAASGLTVTNNAGGAIQGVASGVNASNALVLTNAAGATVSGGTGAAIDAANSATITNNGSIVNAGAEDGIEVGDSAVINNNTNFVIFIPVSGGSITGAVNGISAGNSLTLVNQNLAVIDGNGGSGVVAGDSATITNAAGATIVGSTSGVIAQNGLTLTNSGSITGEADDGVNAQDNAIVTNNFGATISGADNGVWLDDSATVTNDGTITGTGGVGVRVGTNSTVTNTGVITGATGVNAFDFGGTFVLTNSGTITGSGGVAIDGLLFGADTLDLNDGSVINGDIITRGGSDAINLTSSGVLGVEVNGDINGGFGTDTLTFDGGLATIGGASNEVHGDVTFMQDIVKNGTGVAFIGTPGDPSFTIQTDAININGGGLYLNGDIDGSLVAQTVINAGGSALGGTGNWDAVVNLNAGGFSAGAIPINLTNSPEAEAIGSVVLTGDLNIASGTFIRFDVEPQATISNGINSDLIEQNGVGNTTTIAAGAGLRISPTDVNQTITDGTYTVIDSDDVITGTLPGLSVQYNGNIDDTGAFVGTETLSFFAPISATGTSSDAVIVSEFTTVGTADGGTNLVITVTHDYESLALTPNQAALGAAIDASVGTGDLYIQDFIAALDNSDLFTVQETLADLTPEAIFGLADAILNSNYRLHRQVQDHLAVARSSGSMVETVQTTPGDAKDAKGGMAPAQTVTRATNDGNIWGGLSYDWQDYQGEFGTDDFDGETGAFTVGIDYRFDNFVVGALLDGSSGDFDGGGTDTDIESLRGAVYGTWGASTGLYVDALVGYGTHDIDSDRSLGGILLDDASSSTDAESLQALLTVGYAMGDERVKHGPFAGLEYQNVEVDGFVQDSILPVEVEDFDVDSLRGLLGYRVNGDLGKFRPYASVAYAHEFEDGRASTTAFFGSEPFTVEGAERGSSVLVTVGTGIGLTNDLTLDVGYRGDISLEDEGVTSHGGTVGVNWTF